jgi:hypothetical protein
MDTSVLDRRLAPDDFLDRICLVKMSPPNSDNGAIASGNTVAVNPGDEVSAHRLWPALKFDSHRELMDLIKTRVRPSKLTTKIQTSLTVEWNRLLRDPNNRRTQGIAYLIGRGGSRSSHLVILSKFRGV